MERKFFAEFSLSEGSLNFCPTDASYHTYADFIYIHVLLLRTPQKLLCENSKDAYSRDHEARVKLMKAHAIYSMKNRFQKSPVTTALGLTAPTPIPQC